MANGITKIALGVSTLAIMGAVAHPTAAAIGLEPNSSGEYCWRFYNDAAFSPNDLTNPGIMGLAGQCFGETQAGSS